MIRTVSMFLVMACALALAENAFAAAAANQKPPEEGGEAPASKAMMKRKAFGKLREILKAEPTAKEVQNATLKFYKLEPDRIASMERAARLKALVPEFEAGMDNSVGHSFTRSRDGLFPASVLRDLNPAGSLGENPLGYKELVDGTTDQFLWRVRAVWNLDRLVFNAETLDVKSLSSIEENLVREVTTLFYSRRRHLAQLVLSPPDDEEEMFYEQVRLDEMTSTLDALTGGYFGPRAYKGELGGPQ